MPGRQTNVFPQLVHPGLGLDRMFLTGVPPILLNDVTSGDNIKTDIHILPHYADLCGFTDNEIKQLVQIFADSLEARPLLLISKESSVFPDCKAAWIFRMFVTRMYYLI